MDKMPHLYLEENMQLCSRYVLITDIDKLMPDYIEKEAYAILKEEYRISS